MLKRAIWILLSLSAGVNVVQAYRIQDLTSRIEAFKGERQLRLGTAVPALGVVTSNGSRIEVRPVLGKPLLVYWMSPDCAWCLRNEANMKALILGLRDRMRIVLLTPSVGTAAGYDALGRLGEPILGEPDAATAKALRLGGTPETIVVSPEGRVEKVWTGAYLDHAKTEIQSYFGLALPGLVPEAKKQRGIE